MMRLTSFLSLFAHTVTRTHPRTMGVASMVHHPLRLSFSAFLSPSPTQFLLIKTSKEGRFAVLPGRVPLRRPPSPLLEWNPSILRRILKPVSCYSDTEQDGVASSGLRSLYTLISTSMTQLEYLQPSIGVVLGFIGSKMILDFFEASLCFVAASLGVGILLSFKKMLMRRSSRRRSSSASDS